jgi:cell wall-associated NlpC family hydrolase
VGLGSNAFLGCKARDTRGRAGTGTITVPTLNQKVVTVANRQLGDPYVWGATGPDAFDCSGLVMFSYGRGGYTTPRVSEDQARAARLIPAARAVPGDLVFYHDRLGDVYHVGIYLSPGNTVAAIDPAHGVAYQQIWDPTVATYGSFTHT